MNQFFSAIYRFDKYPELVKNKFLKVLFYFIVLSGISIIITFIPFISFYFENGGMNGIIEKNVPEFTIENGKLSTQYKLDKDLLGQIKIVVNTENPSSLDEFPNYLAVLLVNDDKIIIKNREKVVYFTFEQIQELGIAKKKDLLLLIPMFKIQMVVSFLVILISLILSNLISILFLGVGVNIINIFVGAKVTFREALNLTIYSVTSPVILRLVLSLIGVSMPMVVFMGVTFAYAFIGLKNIKKESVIIAKL